MTDLALWLHIVAAAAWLGGNLVMMMMPGLLASGGPPTMLTLARASLALGRVFFTPAAVATLLTGIWLVIETGVSWGAAFVSIGFAAVGISAVLSMLLVAPATRRRIAALEGGDDEQARSLAPRASFYGVINVLVLLTTYWAMVARWGL